MPLEGYFEPFDNELIRNAFNEMMMNARRARDARRVKVAKVNFADRPQLYDWNDLNKVVEDKKKNQ